MEIVGLIPCKTKSRRVPFKNFILDENKESFLTRAIKYLQSDSRITKVVVTTDDVAFVKKHVHDPSVVIIKDPDECTYLPDLYMSCWEALGCPNVIVATTPDNPIRPSLKDCLDEFFSLHGLHEYYTTSLGGVSNGALRIMSHEALDSGYISGYSFIHAQKENVDINTMADLDRYYKMKGIENEL